MNPSVGGTQEEKLEKLRSDVRRGKWPKVFETFVQERVLRTANVTGTGDTMLHMAVSNGQEKVVANMVNLLVLEENKLAQNNVVVTVVDGGRRGENWNVNIVLGAENDRKNTSLHLAATKGNIEMCKMIGGADPSLIARRNIAGETPLFLAAHYGRKEVFLWLHYQYLSHLGVSSTNEFAHCIRDNDDTILHCAVAREHFDVAIEIVHLYRDNMKEMMMRNKEGLTPLHLLAAKRLAFKSTRLLELSILGHPIYWLLKVEEKNQAMTLEELHQCLRGAKVKLIQRRICNICQHIVKTIGKWFYQIQKMKEDHTRSLQIMNQLLRHASNEDMSQVISRTASEHLSISLQTEENCNGTKNHENSKKLVYTALLLQT